MYVKHGKKNTRLYRIWLQMKNRCFNIRTNRYKDYGGRGITICDEWKNDFTKFYDWSILNGYQKNLTIDRINNDGNYEPSNCRWVTVKIQNRNSRSNHLITFDNETHTLIEWCEIKGLTKAALQNRLRYGWSIEKSLTTPVRKHKVYVNSKGAV